jgi:NADP-dependent 3-hydroxy acid dehydrogenase YdfG
MPSHLLLAGRAAGRPRERNFCIHLGKRPGSNGTGEGRLQCRVVRNNVTDLEGLLIDKPLEGQVAVVTGASHGIGKAIALALAAERATVCLIGRDVQALGEVADLASDKAVRVASYRIDLTRDGELQGLTSRLQEDFGRVDILIHSAGNVSLGTLSRAPVGDFDSLYQINLRVPYLLTQVLLPMLVASQGQVVFINSSIGLTTRAEVCQYAATKYALRAVADSLRDDVNGLGVRVLSIYPGRTATRRQAALHEMTGKPYRPERLLQPGDVAAMVLSALKLPRTAEVTDISMRPFQA